MYRRILIAVLLVGCSKQGVDPLQWRDCAMATGIDGDVGQCTTLTANLRGETPEEGSITLGLRRYGTGEDGNGQLWLVQGGPGGSTLRFDAFLPAFAARSGMDIYMLEQRGVGDSGRLGCDAQQDPDSELGTGISVDELVQCWDDLKQSHDIAAYSPTYAAQDLAAAIDRVGAETSGEVQLFGVSYGSLVVQRFLLQYPSKVDAVVLDSPVSHLGTDFLPDRWLENTDTVARTLLQRCADDPQCLADVGADPEALLEARIRNAATTCPGITSDPRLLRKPLSTALETVGVRDGLPAFVKRLDRCSPQDVTAMQHFLEAPAAVATPTPYPEADDAEARLTTYAFIVRTEWMGPNPPDLETYVQMLDDVLIGWTHELALIDPLRQLESYPADAYFEQLPQTDVPVAFLYGGLDFRTPPWEHQGLREAMSGPGQWGLEFPTGRHGLYRHVPDGGTAGDGCFWDAFEHAVRQPGNPPSSSCVDDFEPIDFASTPERAQQLFGTDDFYD